MLVGLEAGDDGNTAGGDGCSANCSRVEQGFVCPVPGSPCVTAVMARGLNDLELVLLIALLAGVAVPSLQRAQATGSLRKVLWRGGRT